MREAAVPSSYGTLPPAGAHAHYSAKRTFIPFREVFCQTHDMNPRMKTSHTTNGPGPTQRPTRIPISGTSDHPGHKHASHTAHHHLRTSHNKATRFGTGTENPDSLNNAGGDDPAERRTETFKMKHAIRINPQKEKAAA